MDEFRFGRICSLMVALAGGKSVSPFEFMLGADKPEPPPAQVEVDHSSGADLRRKLEHLFRPRPNIEPAESTVSPKL